MQVLNEFGAEPQLILNPNAVSADRNSDPLRPTIQVAVYSTEADLRPLHAIDTTHLARYLPSTSVPTSRATQCTVTVHVDAAAAHAVLPFSETEWLAFRRTGTTSVDIPDLLASPHFPNTFSLGVVVGPSGSGKSRILSNLRDAATAPQVPMTPWSSTDSVRSYFGVHVDILRELGLPERVWSLPFPALSVGEQSRAALARQLLEATAFESAAGITAPSRSSLMLGQSGTRLDASVVS